jgi:hypothetical protein
MYETNNLADAAASAHGFGYDYNLEQEHHNELT